MLEIVVVFLKIVKNLILDVENASGATSFTLAKLYIAESKKEYDQIIKWHEANGFSKDFEGTVANSETLDLIGNTMRRLAAKKIIVFKKKNNFGVVKDF